jgi:A/G-specific adenine glycosylase
MLQQTQVATVIPYYRRFLTRFPTVLALADADEQSVLKLWEGLGYYSRARHLHAGAKLVATQFGGKLPADLATLKTIPGIGDYAAGAIASIAFGIPAPAVDGNVLRVLARLWSIASDVRQTAARRAITERLTPLIPPRAAGDFTQALMELGALVCRPAKPLCKDCPIRRHCEAAAAGVADQLPVRSASKPVPHRHQVAFILRHNNRFLAELRQTDRLLKGLWEFPGAPLKASTSAKTAARKTADQWGLAISKWHAAGTYHHTFSHFKLTLHVLSANVATLEPASTSSRRWFSRKELDAIPMSALHRRIAKGIPP